MTLLTDSLGMSDTEPNPNIEHFDVFLCHNSEDKAEIRLIADELIRKGLNPWLDEREILPGTVWQDVLSRQIGTIKAAAVFVGKSGISPWQQMEIRTLIDQFVKRACPVIPVILSLATEMPELPIFLQNFHWVDFRQNHPDPYERLISGIAGKKSDHVKETASASGLLDSSQDDAEGRLYASIINQPDEVDRRQLGILRDRVQEYWVDGVLRQSLYHEVLILLGKRTMDEVVERPPWKYDVVDLPDRCRNVLPQIYTINTVFDATRFLLILGEPGSGKTTSLLELAAVLISRATSDPKERVPIVLSLSSWQKQQSLEEWIATELSAKYRVPKSIARAWLTQNYLVPLLDGLDEVQPANQSACVTAVNAFIETHKPSGLVVCSRLMEYQWLPKKLKLNGAVCIEPLSPQDVNNFIVAGSPQLTGLQQALASDPVLEDLAQTPLMLSIMSLASEGADGEALVRHKDDSPQAHREHIFRLYVERMFQRKKSIISPFSQDQAIGWLSWLARKMKKQSQSVFMMEELQPCLLDSMRQRLVYEAAVALFTGLTVGLIISLVVVTGGSLSEGLWLGIFSGISFFVGCRTKSPVKNGVVCCLLIIMLMLLLGGLVSFDKGWIFVGSFIGVIGGVGVGSLKEIYLVEAMVWRWRQFFRSARVLMIILLITFFWAQIRGPEAGQFTKPSALLDVLLGLGLLASLVAGLSRGLVDQIRAGKESPNQGVTLSLRNALMVLLICELIGEIVIGLFAMMANGLDSTLGRALVVGLGPVMLVGLTVGLNRGGSAVVKHYALRLILWLTGATPFRFIPFLDHCAKLILLKKVGGGYIFIHRTLLEYFAALPLQDNTMKKASPSSAP